MLWVSVSAMPRATALDWANRVDKVLIDSYLGQAVGWDTATGWMNVVERKQPGYMPPANRRVTSSSAARPQNMSAQQLPRPIVRRSVATSSSSGGSFLSEKLGDLADGLTDGITEVAGAVRRRGRGARASRNSDDEQNPELWTITALRAYLASAPGQKPLVGNESHAELVRRCCIALGRPVPLSPEDDGDDEEEYELGSYSGVGSSSSDDISSTWVAQDSPRAELPTTSGSGGIKVKAADEDDVVLFQQLAAVLEEPPAASEHMRTAVPRPEAVNELLFGNTRAKAEGRADKRGSSDGRSDGRGDGRSDGRGDGRGNGRQDWQGDRHGGGGGGGGGGSGGGSRSAQAKARGRSGDYARGRDEAGHQQGERGNGGSGGGKTSSGQRRSPAATPSAAPKARRAKHSTGAGKRAPPIGSRSAAEEIDDAERAAITEAAVKRVSSWAEGKGFVAMINTVSAAFAQPAALTINALSPTADQAARKRAFHKASKALHPDRLGTLPQAQRAEAVEVFKCLSAAYHAES